MLPNKWLPMEKHFKNKNILITGGLGMIGSSIANQLVKWGARVTIIDACLKPYGANEFNIHASRDKIKFYKIDIRDLKALPPIIKGCDIIFNLAGQVSHNDSLENPFLDTEINYCGHLNVLETVRRVNPKIKILYSGSRLQFGKIEKIPVNEAHLQRPLTPYALNKSAAESMYLFYQRLHGIPVVIFRIANPYGPRGQMLHNKYCMINWFIRQAMENKTITIYGNGEQIRDYIYIDDLVAAFIHAAVDEGCDGQAFNVGSGLGVTFNKMAEIIIQTVRMGKVIHIPWPKNYINVETGDYISDIKKIKNVLGWQPEIGLAEGIAKTHAYYKKFKSHYF
jgi:UDP-glucose 4-epimerase